MKFREHKVRPLDPLKATAVDDLVRALDGCGFQGRKLSQCVEVWEAMCSSSDCLKVLSLSGAMVPAGMGEVIMRLMEARAVDVLISTGANVSHDLVNSVSGQEHYLGTEFADDDELRCQMINRIFDVFLPEDGYEAAQQLLRQILKDAGIREKRFSTVDFTRLLGEHVPHRSILQVAARCDIPVFLPAISDSEVGMAVGLLRREGLEVSFDEVGDVARFAGLLAEHDEAGCIVIGGGVPRNWAQQVFPYIDHLARRNPAGRRLDGFHYGVRITTDRPDFGGLSGCTFEEAKSWGKYAKTARFASVVCDATIALPLVATSLLERLASSRSD